MSVPKSKVLSVSKGLIGLNEMRTGCPTNHQNVVVNVHNDLNSTPKSIRKACVDGEELSDVIIVEPTNINEDVKQSAKIKCESSNVQTREISSVEDMKADYEQLLKVVKTKDAITQALSIMLNLIEHNPLIVNKYIISPKDILINLIQLLTEADKVDIIMAVEDVECGCTSSSKANYSVIDKIYVSKDGNTSILKYGFAECLQVLETHRISTKFCIE